VSGKARGWRRIRWMKPLTQIFPLQEVLEMDGKIADKAESDWTKLCVVVRRRCYRSPLWEGSRRNCLWKMIGNFAKSRRGITYFGVPRPLIGTPGDYS